MDAQLCSQATSSLCPAECAFCARHDRVGQLYPYLNAWARVLKTPVVSWHVELYPYLNAWTRVLKTPVVSWQVECLDQSPEDASSLLASWISNFQGTCARPSRLSSIMNVSSVSLGSTRFRRVRKIAESNCWLCHVCPSVRPHGAVRLPVDGFSWNLLLDCFSTI